jgi:enoyl-[acyl-carrier protein] reductase III
MHSTVTALQCEIHRIFADVTRYPLEVLEPEANLEDDLGIDSVKLGEIFSVLREKYCLPEKLDLPMERLKTIAGITEALQEFLSRQDWSPAEPSPRQEGHRAAERLEESDAPSLEMVQDRLREVFATVTRYPLEILELEASLEDDLGIDSVKLGEIFSVLREEYRLPDKLDIPATRLTTLANISAALHEYLLVHSTPALTPGNGTAGIYLEDAAPLSRDDRGNLSLSTGPHDAHLQSFAALSPALKPFRGKIAFISGSGRGLGKDIAVYLAELGATVVINSFHSRSLGDETAAEITASGGEAWHLWGSMANNKQLHAMFDQIEQRYGVLDFFISNASNGMLAAIEELTVEHWEKAFRTNVIGLHQGALRAAHLMKKRGGGKIITLSSPAAHGYVEYFGCMGSVKAAVECLTRALAIEFAPYNIQVNCVSPGPIDGELLRKWPDSTRLMAQWTESTPIGRLCEHREVSHFIAYLLSEPVKAFTGSLLVLDGGISAQGW